MTKDVADAIKSGIKNKISTISGVKYRGRSIGCLGEIAFEVSPETVRTVESLEWSGSARIVTHERHNYHALTEYTGMDPDKMTLKMYFSAYLGVNPLEEVVKIWEYERKGIPVALVLGEKIYGKYRWLVEDHEMSAETFDGDGNVTSCTVSVKLIEYIEM